MPAYSRFRYSPRSRRYRRYYKRYYRGRYKSYYKSKYRFANGSSSARTRIKIPFTRYLTIGFDAGSAQSYPKVFTAWADQSNQSDCYPGGAISSQIYATYSALYDEVKCEGIKLKGTLLTSIDASHPALTLITTVDKKFTADELAKPYSPSSTLIATPAAQKITYNNNSYGKFVRRVYATDLNEKITFMDSTPATGSIPVSGSTTACTYLPAWLDLGNGFTGFSPAIFFGGELAAAPAATTTYTFYIEGNVYLTFRNPRFGLTSSAKAVGLIRSIGDAAVAAETTPLTRTDTTLVDIEDMTS